MPVSLTTLTGPVYLPNGNTPVGGRVSFELSSWDREEGEALFISGPVYANIDQNGQFSVELFTTTAGVNGVVYKMYVLWEDSSSTHSYTNATYNSFPSPHFSKRYIGSFALAGAGPFMVSDLNIVSELEANSFDVLLECSAYATACEDILERIDLGELDVAVAAAASSAASANLSKVAVETQAAAVSVLADLAENSANASGVSAAASAAALASASTASASAQASAAQAALYDGPEVIDLAAFLTNTSLTYTAGQPGTVVAGNIVKTRTGWAMRVEVSGFAGAHMTTAGDVRLTAVSRDGEVSPKQFGAPAAPTNSATQWQAMANYAVPLGLTMLVDGNYAINSRVTHPVGPMSGTYGFNPTFKIRNTGGFTISTTMESQNVFEVPGFEGAPGRQYHGLRIENVNFRGPGTATAAVGFIGLSNCRMPVVTGNTFAGSVLGVGVDIWSQGSGGSYGAVIEDNHFGYQNAVNLGGSNMRNLATQVYPVALRYGIRTRGPGSTSGKVCDTMFAKNTFYCCVGSGIHQGWHTSYSGDGGSSNIITQANKFVFGQTRDIEEHQPVISATASTVTWAVTPTINDTAGLYTNFVAKIVSGTGAGQSRQITGDTINAGNRTATVTPDWTVTPDATSEVRITMADAALIAEYGVSNIPAGIYFDHNFGFSSIADYFEETNAHILGGLNATTNFYVVAPIMKVSDSQWCKKVNGTPFGPRHGADTGVGLWDAYPTHAVATGFTLVRGEGIGGAEECGPVGTITNSTGGDMAHGDVGRRGTAGVNQLEASAANADRPLVVVSAAARVFPNGATVTYALPGALVRVKVSGVVNENDTIVGSTTPKTAMVNNAQTDPKKILGYARSILSSGYALVEIR